MFVELIDRQVLAVFPNPLTCPELHELVRRYQTHTQSKTCRKYRNLECRFNFERFFTDKTITAKPINENMSKKERKELLRNRENLLSKVKNFINKHLNPSNHMNYIGNLSIMEL